MLLRLWVKHHFVNSVMLVSMLVVQFSDVPILKLSCS